MPDEAGASSSRRTLTALFSPPRQYPAKAALCCALRRPQISDLLQPRLACRPASVAAFGTTLCHTLATSITSTVFKTRATTHDAVAPSCRR